MRVAIYSPYLDTFGGGERYMLNIAEILSDLGEVDLLFDDYLYSMGLEALKDKLAMYFGLYLSKVNAIRAPLGKNSSFFKRLFFLKKYDLFVYLTDGSVFIPTAKKNIIHIQTPLIGQPAKSLWGRIKLMGWNLIIYNSYFTQEHSKKNWPIPSKVVYPPVDVDKIKPLKKRKYILSVGRFFGYLKDKKHSILIDSFRKLYEDKKVDGWILHLVGSASEGDKSYIDELKNLSSDLPVKFHPNLGYDDLNKLYGESSIYWHASGYGEKDPTKMEHFGISTVEAMAGGSVPVVIGKGGQLEIVEHNISGFTWNMVNELEEFTTKLIEDKDLMEKMSKAASKRAQEFSKEKFRLEILDLIKN